MRIGLGLAEQACLDVPDSTRLAVVARGAEQAGFDSLWVMDSPVGPAGYLEPLSTLAHLAAVTSTIGLGTAVLLSDLRHPLLLAQQSAAVDRLSEGRLVLGLGLGATGEAYRHLGISPRDRVARFEEGVGLLKELWTGAPVSAAGRFFDLAGVRLTPAPVQSPHPPLWFGARAEPALARAVRMGTGWVGAGSASAADFVAQRDAVLRLLEAGGRTRESFTIARRVYLHLGEDSGASNREMTRFFSAHYGDGAMARDMGLSGSVEEVADALGSLADLDVDLLVINLVGDLERQFEIVVEELMPRLASP